MGDIDAHFFEAASDPFEAEPEVRNPRLVAVRSIAAQRRRAHFARYVAGAVVLCSALCVAALVKASVGRGQEEPGLSSATRPAQAATLGALLAPRAASEPSSPPSGASEALLSPPPTASEAPSSHEPQSLVEAVSVPARMAMAASADPPSASAAPLVPPSVPNAGIAVASSTAAPETSVAPVTSAKEAAAARETARAELSRGRASESIEAGERAVALDPTDGEAWLILGAAYQQKGAAADARRCYKACLEQGKRGPKGECSAMLR